MPSVIIPDISHYETVKDWSKVSENAPFLIMKATQRTDWTDPTLKEVVAGCRRHNIPYWLFSYVEKGNLEYHVEQVKYLIKVTKDLGILGSADEIGDKYFVGWCLDFEDDNSVDGTIAATRYLYNNSGIFKAMVYIGHKDYNRYKKLIEYISKLDSDRIGWWEARYGKNRPTYNPFYPPHKTCILHQYTDRGSYPGIMGDTDLNRISGDKSVSWFTNRKTPKTHPVYKPKGYSGEFVKKFPPRGFYKKGDGYLALKGDEWRTEIKKIQKLASFVSVFTVTIDGEYGSKTMEAVRSAQRELGVKADGYFGPKTNAAAKKFRR